MEALRITRAGSLDHLAIGDLPIPEPGPGEVQISVHAVTVNPADWKIVEMGVPSWKLPMAAGLDCAGEISATGPDVADWSIGDRVLYHSSFLRLGAFAEYAAAPAHTLARIPETVSFAQAAALPGASYTAYQAIEERIRPLKGDAILIHAAAGGVGGAAVQLARARGATVIGTCSPVNNDYVKTLGADHCIDYNLEDVPARIREITHGHGVDAVFNTVSPDTGANAIPMLAFQGHMVTCVGLPEFAKIEPPPRGIQITDIALGGAYLAGDIKAQSRFSFYGDQILELITNGQFDPMVELEWEFDRIIEAMHLSKSGHQRGKIVLHLKD